jgi:hypothetical protein
MLIAWLLGTLALLALHQPLFPRHSAALMPPLALLAAGAGLAAGPVTISRGGQLWAVLAIALAVGLSIPGHIQRWTEREPVGDLAEAATALAAVSEPSEYVLTDMPAIALMGERLIVPDLVDLSGVRLSTGRLTTEFVAEQIERYRPAAILFWLSRLDSGPLERFPATISDQYSRVWQNRPGQSLWIREDASTLDIAGIPDLVELDDSSFQGRLTARAVSFSGQVRSGDTWRLRVLWELLDGQADVELAQLELVSGDADVLAAADLPFSPDKPAALWPREARRMVQYEIEIPGGLQPVRVTPRLRLVRSDGSALRLLASTRDSRSEWLDLPRIQVTRGSSAR